MWHLANKTNRRSELLKQTCRACHDQGKGAPPFSL
jgi:hypothetical protein